MNEKNGGFSRRYFLDLPRKRVFKILINTSPIIKPVKKHFHFFAISIPCLLSLQIFFFFDKRFKNGTKIMLVKIVFRFVKTHCRAVKFQWNDSACPCIIFYNI